MPDRSRSTQSPEDSDFTLDLDQVFSRPNATLPTEAPKPASPVRNRYKLERKNTDPISNYNHFTRTPVNHADADPDEPIEKAATPSVYGKKKHAQPLPELTPNRAYEVMKASSLLNERELVDPHALNRWLKFFGLLLILALGTFMANKLIKSTDTNLPTKTAAVDSSSNQETKIASARQTLQTYLAAKSWKEKAGLILDIERVRPLLSDYYDKFQGKDPLVNIGSDGQPQEIGGKFWLQFNLVENTTKAEIPVRLQETPKGYRLDWENFLALGAMPWADFCAQRPTDATQMRVILTPTENYVGAYADAKKYRSYTITHRFGPPALIGYVERNSRAGQSLEKATTDKTKPANLNLYLNFEVSTAPTQVKIVDIVAESSR